MPSYPDPPRPPPDGTSSGPVPPPEKAPPETPRAGIVLVLFLVGGVLFPAGTLCPVPLPLSAPLPSPIRSRGRREAVGDGLQTQIQELAREEPRARDILSHLEDYPQELLELAVRNPETVDFVADYPQGKGPGPGGDRGGGGAGDHPSAPPVDPRWGCAQYGDGPMALKRLRPPPPCPW